jgi:hypothetical protein
MRARVAVQYLGASSRYRSRGQQHVDDLGEIRLGVQAVQLARGDEREQVGGARGVIVGAEEEPGASRRAGKEPLEALGRAVLGDDVQQPAAAVIRLRHA